MLATGPTDSLEETAAATEATGVDTAGVIGDLTDQDSLEAVREAAVDAFSGIDVVASEGAISREALFDISGDDWDFVTAVALDAVRRVTRAMDEDAIVNTFSLTARLAALLPVEAPQEKDRPSLHFYTQLGGLNRPRLIHLPRLCLAGIHETLICPNEPSANLTCYLASKSVASWRAGPRNGASTGFYS